MKDKLHKNKFRKMVEEQFDYLRDSDTIQRAKEWLTRNQHRIETLFEHPTIRDFVFEPVQDIFQVPGEGQTKRARVIITQVALVNAVIAGLPGSLGVGVYISIALELWMAYSLSKIVGLNLSREEAVDTVLAWAMSAGMVVVFFKMVLNIVFPIITAVMPFAGLGTALTQLLVTNLFGVMFWIMFEELKSNRKFKFPMTSLVRLGSEMRALLAHQYSSGITAVSPAKWKLMASRLVSWLKGEIPTDMPVLRGELAATAAMALLLSNDIDRLSSPLGTEFIAAIRDRYPALADASIPEIAEKMSEYSPEQLMGVVNLIKGKLFERLVARHENQDSDEWKAVLHEDESFPGSDIIFQNAETGDSIEISLKATDSVDYLEQSLLRYPDYPIIATDEVAERFGNSELVWTSGLTNEHLTQVTEDDFDILLGDLQSVEAVEIATTGVTASTVLQLWPFVVAYIRRHISREQLTDACKKVLPKSGTALASRLTYAVVLGPVFAWWLLARGVLKLSEDPFDTTERDYPKRLVLQPSRNT